ncbi:MAG: hypothetical protein JZU49_06260 [Sulfuricurvum sp.]|nr:hypothetical protein [Sulfuricurvum sp.]
MADDILGGKWTLDTTDLKAGLTEANRLIRIADTEFKAAAASIGSWADNADGLSAKIKSLTTIVDVQQQKVQALKDQHKAITETYGANSKAAQDLEVVINKETASLNRNTLELGESKTALDQLNNKTEETIKQKENLRKKTEELTSSMNELSKKALVALTAAAAAAGAAIMKLMMDSGKFADDLITLSNKTGISVQQLQELDYAARFVDVSVETMTGSMNKMTKTMDAARDAMATGKLNDQAQAYQNLGVQITNTDGSLRNNKDVFYEVIDALGKVTNETERDSMSMQIFGKSATELNPLIKAGSVELNRLAAEAHQVGAVVSDEGVVALGDFDDNMESLNASTKGLMNEAMAQLAPVINDFVTQLKDNMPGIIDAIKGFISFVIENGPIIVSLIGGIATGLMAWNVVTMIQGLITMVKGWQAATEGMTLAQALLNIVMAANPVGIIITLIAGLIAGLIILWNTNEGFRKAVIKIFDDIVTTISGAVDKIVNFFKVTLPETLGKVGEWFSNIGENIVKGVWEGIKGMTSWFGDQVGGFFGGIVDGAKKFLGIKSPSRVFAGIGENMALGLGQGFNQEMNSVNKAIQNAIPTNINAAVSLNGNSSQTASSTPSITLNQTISSPKALSAYEVYRQTKNASQVIALALSKG